MTFLMVQTSGLITRRREPQKRGLFRRARPSWSTWPLSRRLWHKSLRDRWWTWKSLRFCAGPWTGSWTASGTSHARQPSRHSPVGSSGQGLRVERHAWTDMGHGSTASHSRETTRWPGRLPQMGLSVSAPRWEPLGSPQGVARCRNQIWKNSNVVPRGHPHRCRSRLDQALTGPSSRYSSIICNNYIGRSKTGRIWNR